MKIFKKIILYVVPSPNTSRLMENVTFPRNEWQFKKVIWCPTPFIVWVRYQVFTVPWREPTVWDIPSPGSTLILWSLSSCLWCSWKEGQATCESSWILFSFHLREISPLSWPSEIFLLFCICYYFHKSYSLLQKIEGEIAFLNFCFLPWETNLPEAQECSS